MARPLAADALTFMGKAPAVSTASLGPEFRARKPRALDQRLELCPHDRGMHATMERPLRKAAICTGNDILAAEDFRQADNALAHELRMLDHVRCVTDDAGNQHLPGRWLYAFPHLPLMLMARIGAF